MASSQPTSVTNSLNLGRSDTDDTRTTNTATADEKDASSHHTIVIPDSNPGSKVPLDAKDLESQIETKEPASLNNRGAPPPQDPSYVRVPLAKTQFALVFLGLALSIFLAALDQTIVSTALNAIVADLGDQELIPWIGTAYLLTATGFSALYGKFADIYGRKITFIFAIVCFEAGSALCGAANGMITLIVGRAIAGIGGGGIFSLVLIIISDIVSIRDRGKYQGMIGGVFGLSSVVGPLVGGAFSDHVSWRWCFYINLPVGLITVITIIACLRFPPTSGNAREKLGRIDYAGTFLLLAFVVVLLTPVQLGGTTWAWSSAGSIAMFVVAAVLLVGFVLVELYVAKEPIIPASLFMNASVPALLLIAICVGGGFFAAVYYISLFFQVVYGDTATMAGVETIPLILGVVILSITSGQVVSRTGRYLPFIYIGGLVMAAGMTLTSFLNAHSGRVEQVFYLLILGLGVGCLIQIRVLALQASVDGPKIAIATATSQFCQSLGGAIGVALAGTILNNVIAKNIAAKPALASFLAQEGIDPANINLPVLRSMLARAPGQEEALADLIDSFAGAFGVSYKAIIVFPALVVLLALFVKQYSGVFGKARTPNAAPPPMAE
ncbi:hypothetical protein HK101_003139 [Irineochytrium annulatum]|nr:hypothetical protein HK101_003139 [Irineochytrium annulatum]